MAIDINLIPLNDYGEINEYKREHYFLFQAFTDSKLEYKDTIEWSDCPKANGIQTMLDAVNSDYYGHLKKAITVVEQYCENFYEDPDIIADFLTVFSSHLNRIHPYFNAKISNFSDLCYVTPADLLFIYQIIQGMIRENNTGNSDYKKDEGYLCEMIYEVVYPIFKMICGKMTTEIEKSLFEDIEKYYNHIVNPNEFLNHELVSIYDTLESLKRLLTILANKRNKKHTIPYSIFMRLYRLGFNEDTKVNFKKEFDECEHPIFLSESDHAIQSINDYENYDYSNIENYDNVYRFFCFEQLGYFYASYLYNNDGIMIRQCDNCGKFFIAKKSKQIYCDNPLKDNPEKTCRDVGAINKRDKKYGTDEVLKLNKNVQKNMSRLKGFRKDDVDEKFIEIIYGFWKNHYALVDKSNTDILLYLKDLYQILSFSINKYIFLYYKKLEKHDFYDLKKQAENCFGRIADHDNELFRAMCNYWRNKVVNLIGESLDKIFPEFAKHESEKTTLVSDEIMKENIEQTLERIVKVHDKAVEIYEKFINTDYDISEVEKVLKENL